jgi:quinolinate synthase
VVVPDLEAGCSLADGCPGPVLAKWLEKYPDHRVVSYINCSAEVKALSDVICTSSNAVKIVQSFPREQKLVFAPDRHLGRWVQKQTGRHDMVLWEGTCIVHESFSEKRILELAAHHLNSRGVAHGVAAASEIADTRAWATLPRGCGCCGASSCSAACAVSSSRRIGCKPGLRSAPS